MKIGLALSGGGIRGVAHIGAIKALEDHNIQADIVSGTSAGSIVGTLYALGYSSQEMLEFVKSFQLYKIFKLSWPMTGLASLGYLINMLKSLEPKVDFEQCKIPLHVTMTNLNTAKLNIMSDGDLVKAVAASCAIPSIFEPIVINDALYVDGGVMKNLPASVIRSECDLLIGINVMPSLEVNPEDMRSLLSIISRTFEMAIWRNQEDDIPLCDIHVPIEGLHQYSLFSVKQIDEIYTAGYEKMVEFIPSIKNKIMNKDLALNIPA
jgi:NTE family protein